MSQRTLLLGYCIDSSALIDLKPYPQDIFQKVWGNLEGIISQGLLIAPEEVLRELMRKDDEISRWAKQHKQMFIDLDICQTQELSNILKRFPNLLDINKTHADADAIIIALAKCKGWSVITNEKHSGNPQGKPKIPDVCGHYNIKCLSLFDFLREEGWRY